MTDTAKQDAGDSGAGGATAAWAVLESKLASSLAVLEEDQYLILSAKRGYGYVQFAAQGSFGIRAEVMSNHYRPPQEALTEDQMTRLRELGWQEPTGKPPEATPKGDPLGSPNLFLDYDQPVSFEDVARTAVRTLADILAMPHPGYLQYDAFDSDGRQILLPDLGLKRRPVAPKPKDAAPQTPDRTRALMLEAARKGFGDDDMQFDKDGELPLRFGSAVLFARVLESPHCISVYSPVLMKIDEERDVTPRLNQLNSQVRFARLFAVDDTVFAAVEVQAVPFVADHFLHACVELGRLADGLDEVLQEQFGGRTAFGEFRSKPTVH